MKIKENNPKREFYVGENKDIIIKDCGKINLDSNELITFITDDKKEYDVVRKDWGFYATPSMNKRLVDYRFKTALVKNKNGMYYIMIVEKDKIDSFNKYLDEENNQIIQWLDKL